MSSVKQMAMVIALIIGTAIASSAAEGHREWRGGYGTGPGNVADVAGIPGLDLSSEQTERIAVLREAHRQDLKPLQEQLMAKSRQLRELWLARTPDRDRILALQRDVHGLRGRLLEKIATYRLEVLQMLTPDQRTKIQTFEAERHIGQMRDHGIGMGPFPGWREGGRPPMGNPFRGKGPGPLPRGGSEGAQGVRETVLPAYR